MSFEESDILKKANAGLETSNLEEAVEVFAQVMQMVCDRDNEIENLGTSYRNEHAAVKTMASHLKTLVDFGQIDDLINGAYTKLQDRSQPDENAHSVIYAKYWGAMDASNLSGILFSFHRDMTVIRQAAAAIGETLEENPIAICMVDKICQLARA